MERLSRVGEYMGMGRYTQSFSGNSTTVFTVILSSLQCKNGVQKDQQTVNSSPMIIFRCSCNYFSSAIGFSVCYYQIIHSFLTLLSLQLAELGSLEAFHYSINNSKEFCCSVCCTSSSSFSLFLSLSLSLCF